MYVRFIVLAPRRRRPFGLFNADAELLEDPTLPQWLREPMDEHLRWFRANLPLPFRRRPKRRCIEASAICWFTPEARDHIARAHELAWLIAEAGRPTAMITTKRVGEIVYRDEHQVVAKPDPRTRVKDQSKTGAVAGARFKLNAMARLSRRRRSRRSPSG